MNDHGGGARRDTSLFGRLMVALAAVLAVVVGLSPSSVGATTETTNPEDYPPKAIVNLLDPFGCEPSAISGEIGEVEAGSDVTLQLLINGVLVETVVATADAEGQVEYTIPVPSGQYGPAIVRANGTNSIGQPFELDTSGTITRCPTVPVTGSSATGPISTVAAGVLLLGVMLATLAARRRRSIAGA